MKKFIIILTVLTFSICTITAGTFNLGSIEFRAIDASTSGIEIPANNGTQNYNLVFSSVLPMGGVYVATDEITGAEAIVQIGYSQIESSLDQLFCSSGIYSHFANKYDITPNEVRLKLKFIGWNKNSKEMNALSIDRLIVTPNKTVEEMKKVDENKYYIQLGSYHFYQNSYPRIIEVLSFLDSYPKFYIMRKTLNRDDKNMDIYRVLSGPFDYEEAKAIANEINSISLNKVFVQSQKKLINEDTNEVIYEDKK